MNRKAYKTLELDKILAQLAVYAAFSASESLLQNLEPTPNLQEALYRQQETGEARALLEEKPNITIGGARDVRPHARNAERSIVLAPQQLLEIKATLQSGAALRQTLRKAADRFPLLNEIGEGLYEGKAIVAAIGRAIDERGEVLDSASPDLARIRHDLRVAHDRLHTRLQSIVNNSRNAPYLQEALITVRGGRYVIPIKAEHKGRIKGIVHDQSASGATLFIEPLATVETNNQIRELELAEQEEIRRILTQITALVGSEADPIVWSVETLAALDAALAKAKYADALHASPPALVDFDPERTPGSTIRLYGARHPLLDPQTVVPIDVELDEESYVLIITGPNTGGKTVSLKTVGLMTLMAQCGLHLPVFEGSVLTVFDSVFADIGDEQSIEQSLSTFSAHLTNIVDILAAADGRSLVLLDELGAGTDPAEGSAIARAILNDLLRRGVTTFVATHYPELKIYAHGTPGVRNASVEFDAQTLAPTYRLIIGLPGRSNALAIATRLGLPQDITEEARSYVGEADLEADDLLDEIHRTREEIRQTQARLSAAEDETLALHDELKTRLEGIEGERRAVVEQTRQQAQAEMDAVRAEIRDMRRRLKTLSPTQKKAAAPSAEETIDELADEAASLDELVEAAAEPVSHLPPAPPVEEPVPQRELRPGDRVFVSGLNAEGEIVSIDSGDDVEVQVGRLRVRVDADDLEWRSGPEEPRGGDASTDYGGVTTPRAESPGLELHLLGFTVEDALPVLEEYLDRAYLAGLPWVRVIHGKGTGVLRKAVHKALRESSLVTEFESARENEGGDGATIVRFASPG